MPKVKIEDETHEVDVGAIELDEGQMIINKDNPPEGLFTKEAFEKRLKDRLKSRDQNIREELVKDKEFQQEILDKYDISLDENGNPKGLKPDFDPEEWKAKKAQELTKPLKDELETFKGKYDRAKKARIEDAILAATKGLYKDELTTAKDNGKVKPVVVNQFRELFDENDKGEIVLRDGESFAIDGNGDPVTPDKYLSNAEKFGDWMIDKRQRSSGYQGGTGNTGKRRYTRSEISNMSSEDFAKNQSDIITAGAEGRIDD